ncbi:MAG: competence/damage-inducible protein A [Acidobacteria bacterium]|nr:competence/damage-inducible protein A [Acidobacteriota bacterium]
MTAHMPLQARRRFATAEIIAVGSELLTPFRSDTNSLFLTARLNELGIRVRHKTIVGDDGPDLAAAVQAALGRVDLVVTSGGLGPTEDDLTRETVAELLGLKLVEQSFIVESLEARFAATGRTMPCNNRRQALVPSGAVLLDNPRGTAPGLWLDIGDQVLVLLPGPPRELEPMFEGLSRDRLAERVSQERLYRRVLRVAGLGESHVEEKVAPIYSRWFDQDPAVDTTVLASPGLVELHLSTRATPSAATEALDGLTQELADLLGDKLVSTDGRSLSEVVGELLRQNDLRVAVGESCTGGLVTAGLVDVPGSSLYVEAGVVAYSNEQKQSLLGVVPEILQTYGAVSEEVALAMAEGVRCLTGAELGVGVTGVAGPSGGGEAKPVGTVCLGVVGPGAAEVAKTVCLPGDRGMVRQQSTQTALNLLRLALLGRVD